MLRASSIAGMSVFLIMEYVGSIIAPVYPTFAAARNIVLMQKLNVLPEPYPPTRAKYRVVSSAQNSYWCLSNDKVVKCLAFYFNNFE